MSAIDQLIEIAGGKWSVRLWVAKKLLCLAARMAGRRWKVKLKPRRKTYRDD